MMDAEALDRIFADPPIIHRIAETGDFRAERSTLRSGTRDYYESLSGRQNYGITIECARLIFDTAKPGIRTLETGIGLSTVIFALGGSDHVTIAPFQDEIDELSKYAHRRNINLSKVTFIASGSEAVLPEMTGDLDSVFIDGMHAFPWPILDWFFTADRLKVGGLIILDDTQLPPVAILSEFLRADSPRWQLINTPGGRTDVFRKLAPAHDVAWHEQPWSTMDRRTFRQKVSQRLARLLPPHNGST